MRKKAICLSIVLLLCLGIVLKTNIIPFSYKNIDSAYGISSSNSIAVDVGMKVLKGGGNAVDATAAISLPPPFRTFIPRSEEHTSELQSP